MNPLRGVCTINIKLAVCSGPQPFHQLDDWLEGYREYWAARLDDLEAHLENSQTGGRT